jgi:hypothetical protein
VTTQIPHPQVTAERVLVGLVVVALALSFVLYVIMDQRWAKNLGAGAIVVAFLWLVCVEFMRRRRRAAKL